MDSVEERTIQEIRGSYIIYLPKEWCIKNGIRKKSRVRVRYAGPTLFIEALNEISNKKVVTIQIHKMNEKMLQYIIIALYLLGIDKIRLISRRNISLKERRVIRRIIESFTRYVISYEGKNFIDLSCSYIQYDIWTSIFKVFNSLASILNYFLEILTRKDKFSAEDLEEIEAIDSEIDLLRHDFERMFSKSLINLKSEVNLDLKSQDILVRIVIIVERMIDHLNALARLSVENGHSLDAISTYIAKLNSTTNHIIKILENIRDTKLYGIKLNNFNGVIQTLIDIIQVKVTFHTFLERDVIIDIVKYHILRLYDYITDITELLLDWIVKIYYIDYEHMLHM
ncbi:MAG TPA: phosphate uptake regulator PhoU [Thermoprotei archaeon]|nr:phosphate uptake regulator PhoU [Thermoprotei archaeon]